MTSADSPRMTIDSFELRNVASAHAGIDEARYTLREAVIGARLAGHSWVDIGLRLGITRQAASERFACDEQVAKAWSQVERLLFTIGGPGQDTINDPIAVLKNLSQQGRLHPVDVQYVQYAIELRDARNRTVQRSELKPEEAERVTDHAIPLIGNLYTLANPA